MSIDLEAIEARANAATLGPWCEHPNGSSVWSGDRYDCENMDQYHVASTRCREQSINDAIFIAHAREDVPALVAEVKRLRGFISELTEDGCSYGDGCPTFGSNHYKCLACKAKEALVEK